MQTQLPATLALRVASLFNKARLDNRWGCSVGHAFRNFNLSSRLNAHPRPLSGASAWTFAKNPSFIKMLVPRRSIAVIVLVAIALGLKAFANTFAGVTPISGRICR